MQLTTSGVGCGRCLRWWAAPAEVLNAEGASAHHCKGPLSAPRLRCCPRSFVWCLCLSGVQFMQASRDEPEASKRGSDHALAADGLDTCKTSEAQLGIAERVPATALRAHTAGWAPSHVGPIQPWVRAAGGSGGSEIGGRVRAWAAWHGSNKPLRTARAWRVVCLTGPQQGCTTKAPEGRARVVSAYAPCTAGVAQAAGLSHATANCKPRAHLCVQALCGAGCGC
jgi:hypothetical protein